MVARGGAESLAVTELRYESLGVVRWATVANDTPGVAGLDEDGVLVFDDVGGRGTDVEALAAVLAAVSLRRLCSATIRSRSSVDVVGHLKISCPTS